MVLPIWSNWWFYSEIIIGFLGAFAPKSPTDIKVRNYYIVGSIVLTDDARNYLNALRKKYHIPVNYIHVDAENEIHKY